jgi:hypothetical protein
MVGIVGDAGKGLGEKRYNVDNGMVRRPTVGEEGEANGQAALPGDSIAIARFDAT